MIKTSVIIPSYNRNKRLRSALESLNNQTYDEFEVVIVDDGSVNPPCIKKTEYNYPIKYYKFEKNKGANAARNKGIRISSGEYIIFLDSDDIFIEKTIEILVKKLEESENKFAGAFGSYSVYNNDGDYLQYIFLANQNVTFDKIKHSNCIGGFSGVIFRREIFSDIGYLDCDFPSCQDYEFYLRVLKKYDLLAIPDILVIYTHTPGNISSNIDRKKRGFELINKKHACSISETQLKRQKLQLARMYYNDGDTNKSLAEVTEAKSIDGNSVSLFMFQMFIQLRILEHIFYIREKIKKYSSVIKYTYMMNAPWRKTSI